MPLDQSQTISINYVTALIGVIITAVVALYLDHKKNEKQKRDDKIQAITMLRGRKHTMLQSNASYYSAFIQSENLVCSSKVLAIRYIDYDRIRELRDSDVPTEREEAQQYVNREIDLASEKSLFLKEGFRQKERLEKLQQEIAKNEEKFLITIGRIRILFPRAIELIKVIEDAEEDLGKLEMEIITSIGTFNRDVEIIPGSGIESNDDRDDWCDEIFKELNSWVTERSTTLRSKLVILESKIDDLLNYLENELNTPYCKDCKLFCSDNTCPLRPPSQERPNQNIGDGQH